MRQTRNQFLQFALGWIARQGPARGKVRSSAHSEAIQSRGQPGALRALGAPPRTLRSSSRPSPGHGTGKNVRLPMSAPATNFQPQVISLQARKLVSPLQCTLTKNGPVSPLECVVTNSLHLKSFGIHSYKKCRGGPRPQVAAGTRQLRNRCYLFRSRSRRGKRPTAMKALTMEAISSDFVANGSGWASSRRLVTAITTC